MSAAGLIGTLQAFSAGPQTIQLEAGEVLEMTVDTQMQSPDFSWILTRDRTFINAQRSKFFQTRQTTPGNYVLDVNIQDVAENQTDYQVINLAMIPAGAAQSSRRNAEGETRAVLTAQPSNGRDTIVLPADGGIVKLDMSQSTGPIGLFALDLDSTKDSNGDGNPENDRDNQLTINEKEGTPLHILMLPGSSPSRRVILTVTSPDNAKTSTVGMGIDFSGQVPASSAPGSAQPESGVITAERSGLAVTFAARIDKQLLETKQLLFEWDFGDNAKSLLDRPTHTYAQGGDYAVNLNVRDIANGSIVLTASQTLQLIAEVVPSSSAPSSAASSQASSSAPATPGSSAGSFGAIVKVLLIVVMLIVLAVAAFFALKWLKNKTGGKLQAALNTIEDNLVQKPDQPEEKKSTTMKLKKEKKEPAAPAPDDGAPRSEQADKEMKRSEFKSGGDALAAAPIGQDAPVPDWLKGAQTKTESAAAPDLPTASAEQTAPVPDWLKAAETPKASPPPPAAPAPAASEPAAVPDWLKGSPATPAAPAPEPAPAPAPAATESSAPVPDWLKPASTPAQAAPVTSPAEPTAPATAVSITPTPEPSAVPAEPTAPVPDWLKSASAPAPVAAAQAPAAPLAGDNAPVPDWLKGSPAVDQPKKADASSTPDAASVPDWLKGSEAKKADPSPVVQASAEPTAPVPDWLKTGPMTTAPAAPIPTAEPTPEPTAPTVITEPVKPAEPAPTPAPTPEPAPSPVVPADSQSAAPAVSKPDKPADLPVPSPAPAEPVKQSTTPVTAAVPKANPQTRSNPTPPKPQPSKNPQPQKQIANQNSKPQNQPKPKQSQPQKQNQNLSGQRNPQPPKNGKPNQQPKPKPQAKPIEQQVPKRTAAPTTQVRPDDAPIAIIKAESISTDEPATGQVGKNA